MSRNKRIGTILIVEDYQNWRELLIALLEGDGHKVIPASTFAEAMALLKKERFDLAILDMRLVDEDPTNIQGMRILKEAKSLYPGMKAIILTGYPDPDQEVRAREFYHADDYLSKAPNGEAIDIDKFSQRIFELLQA